MPEDLAGLGVGLALKGTPWCGRAEAALPLLGATSAYASGELIIFFPSELVMLICCAFLVKLESFARGLGVATTDLTTLFLPELPVAGFNASLFSSFLIMLGLDRETLDSTVDCCSQVVLAFSGGLMSGLAGDTMFLKA